MLKNYCKIAPLISIHIPKCGGTTLMRILKQWYSDNLFFHYFNEEKGLMPIKQRLREAMVIHGHFNKARGFGIQNYYPEVRQFITVMRDPFDILFSRYFDVKRRELNGCSHRDGKILKIDKDVNEYLEREVQNPKYHPNLLDFMPVEMTMINFKDIIRRRFVYIGLMEDLQFSVKRLAQKLGFKDVELPHLNPSNRFQEVSKDLRQRFVKSHPLEYAVYNYVLENYRKW